MKMITKAYMLIVRRRWH